MSTLLSRLTLDFILECPSMFILLIYFVGSANDADSDVLVVCVDLNTRTNYSPSGCREPCTWCNISASQQMWRRSPAALGHIPSSKALTSQDTLNPLPHAPVNKCDECRSGSLQWAKPRATSKFSYLQLQYTWRLKINSLQSGYASC
jgi:hypothetical protein